MSAPAVETAFRHAMEAAGITTHDSIVADDSLHRLYVEGDKRGKKNGWYRLHLDPPVGVFGCNKRGINEKWRPEMPGLEEDERRRQRARQAAAIEAHEEEDRKRQAKAIAQVREAFAGMTAASDDHPYLVRKAVSAYGVRLDSVGRVVVPVFGVDGQLQSIQRIDAEGNKRFARDCPMTAGRYIIGDIDDVVVVTEGYATGATIHQQTGLPVVCAFSAGNLEPVAKSLRDHHPETTIIIAADDDRFTDGNPGLTKAKAAAAAVGGRVAVPTFRAESTGTDFNDMCVESGGEDVRHAVMSALEAEPVPESEPDQEKELDRLAALSVLSYERERVEAAKALGIRTSILDEVVKALRPAGAEAGGLFLEDVEPWSDPVDGVDLLDELVKTEGRYLSLPPGASEAMALWTIHAHAHPATEVSAILAITSPTPECGKTTCLTYIGAVVPRPLTGSNITTAALFRAVEKWKPTVLIDEADSFLKDNEELRGVLNSGHARAGAYVVRTVGENHEPAVFRTWAPKAIALIGKLPATLESRSIHIELRRLPPGEKVTPLRLHQIDVLVPLQRKAARWATDYLEALRTHEPDIPPELYGRAADNWRALLSIADMAGGDWPQRARQAAVTMSASRSEQTVGILLLEDMRSLFANHGDRMTTTQILEALNAKDDRPWPEWSRGRELTARGLGRLLSPFGITSKTVRVEAGLLKGYHEEQFADTFRRYLPPCVSDTTTHPAMHAGLRDFTSDTSSEGVSDRNTLFSAVESHCVGLSDREPPQEGEDASLSEPLPSDPAFPDEEPEAIETTLEPSEVFRL